MGLIKTYKLQIENLEGQNRDNFTPSVISIDRFLAQDAPKLKSLVDKLRDKKLGSKFYRLAKSELEDAIESLTGVKEDIEDSDLRQAVDMLTNIVKQIQESF